MEHPSVTAVYANFRRHALFLVAACMMLAGCAGGGVSAYNPVPWNSNAGVVTSDPATMPDIAWQTQGQRHGLNNAAATSAPAVSPAQPATPARKFTASLLLPLTGKNGDLGQAMLKAAQMALFDVGSRNFELVPRDTHGTAEGARQAAATAVASGDNIILGPIFAEDVRAVKSVTQSSGTPVVAYSTDWKLADNNTYVMGFLPFAQVTRVAKYAQSRGLHNFAVFAPQTEYCDVVISTLQRTDVQLVHSGRYAPGQADLPSLVRDFVAQGKGADGKARFDALVLPLGGESLRTLVSLLSTEGVRASNVKLVGTGLWDDATVSTEASLQGGWYAAPDPKSRRDFEKRYAENYGSTPPRLASLAYDSTALAAVLAQTGAADAYSKPKLTNPRGFAGIDGVFRFRQDGLSERGLAVLEIGGGAARVVDPAPTAFLSSGS
jgi:branched-chain amino acid transport system substrate-binding protein